MKSETDISDRLSDKSVRILKMIAAGHSYSRIVDTYDDVAYLDIFAAAKEALEISQGDRDYATRILAIKSAHPRAYEPWDELEEAQLIAMQLDGKSIDEIAAHLQRQTSAIRSRLRKLSASSD